MVTIKIRAFTLFIITAVLSALMGWLVSDTIINRKSLRNAENDSQAIQMRYLHIIDSLKVEMYNDSVALDGLRRANSTILSNLDKLKKKDEKRIAELLAMSADSISVRWAAFEQRLDSLLANRRPAP